MCHSDQNLNIYVFGKITYVPGDVCLTDQTDTRLFIQIDSQELFRPRVNERCVDDTNCDEIIIRDSKQYCCAEGSAAAHRHGGPLWEQFHQSGSSTLARFKAGSA